MPTEQIILRILARVSIFAILGAHVCAIVAVLESVLLSVILTCIATRLDLDAVFQHIFFGAPVGVVVGIVVGLSAFGIAAALLKPKANLKKAFGHILATATIASLFGAGVGAIGGSMFGWFLSVALPDSTISKLISLRVTQEFYAWAGGFFFGALFGFAIGFIGGAINGAKQSSTAR